MNIELSTSEYKDLLDILHIADVVMSGHRREEDKRTKQQRTLIQKLYALAQGEGLNRLIAYNATAQLHVPTAEFEETSVAHRAIDEFSDHLFWDELIGRLTARDASQIAGGMDALNALNDHDRQAMEQPIRQRYIQEFSANGIANLLIVEGIGGGSLIKTSD